MYLTEQKRYKKACYDAMKMYMKGKKKAGQTSEKDRADNYKLNQLFSKGKYFSIFDIVLGYIDIDDVTLDNAISTIDEYHRQYEAGENREYFEKLH